MIVFMTLSAVYVEVTTDVASTSEAWISYFREDSKSREQERTDDSEYMAEACAVAARSSKTDALVNMSGVE